MAAPSRPPPATPPKGERGCFPLPSVRHGCCWDASAGSNENGDLDSTYTLLATQTNAAAATVWLQSGVPQSGSLAQGESRLYGLRVGEVGGRHTWHGAHAEVSASWELAPAAARAGVRLGDVVGVCT